MPLTKRTIVDQVEITASNVVQVRLKVQVLEGEAVMAEWYHRASILPGDDTEAVLGAVNTHLLSMKAAPISEWGRVARIVAVVHTPEVVAGFRNFSKSG